MVVPRVHDCLAAYAHCRYEMASASDAARAPQGRHRPPPPALLRRRSRLSGTTVATYQPLLAFGSARRRENHPSIGHFPPSCRLHCLPSQPRYLPPNGCRHGSDTTALKICESHVHSIQRFLFLRMAVVRIRVDGVVVLPQVPKCPEIVR